MAQDTTGSSGSQPLTAEAGTFQYKLIEYVEDLERYCPGGYHPLKIGDDLKDGRYQLVNKLGYGGYSTIWLARDLQEARYVALKAVTADASSDTPEANLMDTLGEASSTPGADIIPPLLDEFWVTDPNGKQKCIVTPPAQMSLTDAKEASDSGLFQARVAQSIIAQLIRGVAFLHSNEIVHGDLHLGNILVQSSNSIDLYSTSEIYEKLGEPKSEAVLRVDGKPLSDGVPDHVFMPGWYGVGADKITHGNERILLSDFGESFNPHTTPRFSSSTPPLLRPPEAYLSNETISFSSDVWKLACTIWEIFGQRSLFQGFLANPDRVTAEQVEALGILPTEWRKDWGKRHEFFNEEGVVDLNGAARTKYSVHRTWDMRFDSNIQQARASANLEIVTEEERRAFEAMLQSMLTFRPGERATAHDALNPEWMKGWGLPAFEETWSKVPSTEESQSVESQPVKESKSI